MPIAKWIGKPYNWDNFNCWDYVSAVRNENGITTKEFKAKNKIESFKLITREMQKTGHGLTLVNDPQDFDIIIASNAKAGRTVYHCGLYHSGNVSHSCEMYGQVRQQTFTEFKADFQRVTIWR